VGLKVMECSLETLIQVTIPVLLPQISNFMVDRQQKTKIMIKKKRKEGSIQVVKRSITKRNIKRDMGVVKVCLYTN
jgi:hypothetical protein